MARHRLTIEYDGAGYSGWQRQENAPSIQQALEQAIARFAPEAGHVAGAGRTDAGVHARGQVAHVDLDREWLGWRLREAINAHLRHETISVVEAAPVAADFDARRSALARHYRYTVINRRAPLVFERGRAWRVKQPLDAAAMHAAAQSLLGRHDFTSFRAAACQAKSPIRTLDRLDVGREGDTITIVAEARSFLHHQVRNLVGTLRLVGDGHWPVERVAAALAARDRSAAGPTAAAAGLCLMRVTYPVDPFA